MQDFYRAIHEVVGELMPAKNFFIALWDEQRQLINWPYHVDETGTFPDPNKWYPLGEGSGRGTTAYVLRTGEPQLISLERFDELVGKGELDLVGPQSEDWLGVPLKAEGAHGRSARRAVVHEGRSLHGAGQGSARVRRPACRLGSLAGARNRGDTAAERRAGADQQRPVRARRGARDAGDLRRRRRQDPGDLRRPGRRDLNSRRTTGLRELPRTSIERGERLWPGRRCPCKGLHEARARDAASRCWSERTSPRRASRYGRTLVADSEMPKSVAVRPARDGERATGVIALDNFDREHAFERFRPAAPGDARRQPERGAGERAAGARDAAAERRARADQQRPVGARRASSTCKRSTTS